MWLCGYHTARGETCKHLFRDGTRTGNRNARKTLCSRRLRWFRRDPGGWKPRVFQTRSFRSPGFGSRGSGLWVCDSEWMTTVCRETLFGADQRSGFRRRWRSVCGRGPAEEVNVTFEDAGPKDVDRSRQRRERARRAVQAGRKIDGRKMSIPCRHQFRGPRPFFCHQSFCQTTAGR